MSSRINIEMIMLVNLNSSLSVYYWVSEQVYFKSDKIIYTIYDKFPSKCIQLIR